MTATALSSASAARASASTNPVRVRLTDGVDLMGEYEGSGYRRPHFLARRPDGQVIQLSELLYLVARAAGTGHTVDEVARSVSEEFGRNVSSGNVQQLIDKRLTPLGVIAAAHAQAPAMRRRDPMLALKFRTGVIPAGMVHAITLLFRALFVPPVVVLVLLALGALDVWLFGFHGVAQPIRSLLTNPLYMLLLLGLVIASAAFHECGHATGCAYGGARPGVMGMGIYLVWPAFYTDVTDAYRLGKAGRLRTDLGGLYFNIIFLLVTVGVYWVTHIEALLAIVLLQHIEMLHQLLPFLRLDGYYIVADLVGIPDLFARIKPVMVSALPWKRTPDSVRELKTWVRVAVTLWVSATVLFLGYAYVMLLVHLPQILATAVVSLQQLGAALIRDAGASQWGAACLAGFQILLLVLPLLGVVLMIWKSLVRLGRLLARTRGHPVLQTALAFAGAGTAALVLVALGPRAHYQPISPSDRGNLQTGFGAMVATYQPSGAGLTSAEAAQPSPPSPTTPAQSTGAPQSASASATATAAPSATAQPTSSATDAPTPTTAPTPTASAQP